MTVCIMETFFPKQKPTVIKYRRFKKFNYNDFSNELQANLRNLNENAKYEDFEVL